MTSTIDKIKLIYDFNPESPLFARAAEDELRNGNVDDAVSILEAGLEKFPGYVSAYLVYAEALTLQKKFDQVLEVMDELKELIDDEKTIAHYLEYFEEVRNIEESKALEPNNSWDDFEKLAEKMQGAKIPRVDEDTAVKPFQENSNKSIVSETLAGIYYSQGSYEEALEMYEKLLDSNPQKSDLYKEKISEIKSQIGK